MAGSSVARKAPPNDKSKNRTIPTALIDSSVLKEVASSDNRKSIKMSMRRKPVQSQNGRASWDGKSSKPSGIIPIPVLDETTETFGPATSAVVMNGVKNRVASASPAGKTFGDAGNTMIQCKHCKKPVYKNAASEHVQDCLRKKQEKVQKKKEAKEAKEAALRKERNGGVSPDPSVDDDGKKRLTSAKKTAGMGDALTGAKKTGKKRKADDEDKGPSKKKKKDDAKLPKAAKPKGPVDVEKQCGVILPNGSMCARSLTCKSHSMGAKRAVPGRSMPYDMLLAQYQKKSHARQHRAAMDANAPLPDDFEDKGNVDSDEERDAVMAAINRYYRPDPYTGTRTMGSPLTTWNPIPVRRRYHQIRLREAMRSALDGVESTRLFQPPEYIATTTNNSMPIFSST